MEDRVNPDDPMKVPLHRFGPDDTDPEAQRFLVESMRRLDMSRKAEMLSALTRAVQRMALAGLRSRYPNASEAEIRLRLAALRLDRETMIRVCGWDPEVSSTPTATILEWTAIFQSTAIWS